MLLSRIKNSSTLYRFPIFTLSILCTLASYLLLSFYSHSEWRYHLPSFLIISTVIQILTIIAFLYAPDNLSKLPVILLAVIVHIIGVFGLPLFEDDYFRYLWDAYTFSTLGTPYGISPESFFDKPNIPDNFQEILGYINHPDLPTIYGPTLQYSFWLAYWLEPGSVFTLQCLYAFANLLIVIIALELAKPKYVLLYVFSPLIFKEVLMTAHPDGFAVALLFAAFWAKHKQHYIWVGIFLGLSIGAKVFAILLIPFLCLRQPFKVISSLIATLSAIYLPFIINSGASDLLGLAHMANNWEFNSAIWGLIQVYYSTPITRNIIMVGLFIILGSYGLFFFLKQRKNKQFLPHGDLVLGIFLVSSPVINPWYCVWLLPFATIRPSLTI